MADDPWDNIHPKPVIMVDAIGVVFTPKKSKVLRRVSYEVPMFVRQWLFDASSFYSVFLLVTDDRMKSRLQKSGPTLFFTDYLVIPDQKALKEWMTMFRGCLVISNLPQTWGVCMNGVNGYEDPETAIKQADLLATVKGEDVFMCQMRAIRGPE